MATNNLSALSSALNSVTNGTASEQVDKVKENATDKLGYIQNVVQNYGSYSDEQKQALRSDPLGFLKSEYENYQANKTDTTTEQTPSDTKVYTPREGQDNVYAGQNTVDHSDDLRRQYDATLEDYNRQVEQATNDSVESYERYQRLGQAEYDKLKDVSRKDYQDAISTREAVEASNGNRDGIGHSQYGTLEQAYNSRLGEIADAENALRTQTTRAVADARAQGDFQKANALLSTAQAKLQALYEEQMRIDKNLRSNFEWQSEIDMDDKKIQAELDMTEKEWQRSMGQALLQAGIVPDMDILDSMGLSREMATKIAKYAKSAGGSGGSGGSGSSGSSGSGGSGSGSVSTDENGLPDDAYSQLLYKQTGSEGAYVTAANAYNSGAWDADQYNSAINYVGSQNYGSSSDGTKNVDYWEKYYG